MVGEGTDQISPSTPGKEACFSSSSGNWRFEHRLDLSIREISNGREGIKDRSASRKL